MSTAAPLPLPQSRLIENPAARTLPPRDAQQQAAYHLRLAKTEAEKQAAFRLRFEIFNLELAEGLGHAYETGMDTDPFDAFCDHLIVEDLCTQRVIGTYRLQTGEVAARNLGYYSETLFDMSALAPYRAQTLELGRACVHADHRSMQVLLMLWRGIVQYGTERGIRYFVGCSSLTSQDEALGAAMYQALSGSLTSEEFRATPHPEFALAASASDAHATALPEPPKLLRAYLAVGAQICGAPAIDRSFGTIDFLTLLDLERISSAARARLLR
jgi:putative hemolysin